ncbi:MAG TPA: protein-disulfide reductase DsbD N-terminal domain-containing protein [Casimicrobiaceae bacterium]|nr:protein-disulfide reductase DsbD N-terminal domain-containing protein [Casimicrobiaceae bacterium]
MSTGLPKRPPSAAFRGRLLWAAAALLLAASALGQSPLPPDRAFRFSARMVDAQTVEARFTIADGYYLYRDRIHFSAQPADAGLAVPALPGGAVKEDPFFGRVETYRGGMVVNLALKTAKPGEQVVIAAESQGCADIGICYPATVQRVTIPIPEASVAPSSSGATPKKPWFN